MGGDTGQIAAPEDPSAGPGPSVDALARAFGLDPEGAEPIRAASRHVVRFPASRALTVASEDEAGSRREAAIASLLAEAGAPTTRCIAGPAPIDGWVVTAWSEIAPLAAGGEVGPSTLGDLAARIHRATSALDQRGVIPCDPVGAALEQVALAVKVGATSHDELALLRRRARHLEGTWHRALAATEQQVGRDEDRRSGAVVHGDLHVGNALVGPDGPVAIDVELAGWGPRAYDAAPTAAFVRWYGRPEADLAEFDRAYGAPLTQIARELHLDEVWALWSTAWAAANRHRSDAAEDEATVRLATLATGVSPRPWHLR